ncbi:MAG: DUF1772 domain-containing protein [Deltaproteobacteria bacterium]|nr:DUF1772 domain-containing protein [Deltaproteobacteria bacterium]
MSFESLATLCSGLFAGASLYINLVEHPARLQCGTALAVAEFAPSYQRAAVMQAALAALGFLSAAAAWFSGSSLHWLVGGLLLGAVIPFTFIAIFPTNKQILDPSLDKESARASDLLHQWGRLHAVRSALSLASFVIFLCLLGAK